jgi:hypothetical protein
MALGLLADRERLDRRTIHPALVRHGTRDGVGAHGEASDPLGMDAGLPEDPEYLQPQEELALGGKGGTTSVDVIGGACATGEDEFPHFQGPLHEELSETMSVFHSKEIRPFGSGGQGTAPPAKLQLPFSRPLASRSASGLLVLGAPFLAGCARGHHRPSRAPFRSGGRDPGGRADAPLRGIRRLDGILVWRSDGRWILAERLSFQGREGDQTLVSSRGIPGELAQEYASLITQLNETPGLRLLGEVDPSLNPECTPPRSRVILTIADESPGRGDPVDPLRGRIPLHPHSRGCRTRTPGAARVITAAQLVRFFTLGDEATSAFQGTVPFGSLDVGDDSPARPDRPPGLRVAGWPDSRPEWKAFWDGAHAREPALPRKWTGTGR